MKGIKKIIIERIIIAIEIGLEKKIRRLPFESSKDWRRFNSSIGPRMKARIRGAPSYLDFLKRYPTIPKMIMTKTSKMLLLML
jgi:hypothetical protein